MSEPLSVAFNKAIHEHFSGKQVDVREVFIACYAVASAYGKELPDKEHITLLNKTMELLAEDAWKILEKRQKQ